MRLHNWVLRLTGITIPVLCGPIHFSTRVAADADMCLVTCGRIATAATNLFDNAPLCRQADDMSQLLAAAPQLLLTDAASTRTRLLFLLQHRGKPTKEVAQDIVR